MKRTLLISALVLASSLVSAQGIIPFIGGNLSGYQVKQSNVASGGVPGLNIGAVADVRISHHFYLQPGLQYAMTGGKIEFTHINYASPIAKSQFRVNTLQLPVMMVLKTGGEGGERFFAGAGFYVAANFKGKAQEEWATSPGHTQEKPLQYNGPEMNTIKSFDFGLSLGAGYHMAVGPELYFFYQKGTVDMLSHAYIAKSTTYQLGVAARYTLKLRKHETRHRS